MDILAGVCPCQLLLMLLWITPQENELAHNWIACALCNFFAMHNLHRVQILLVAKFVNGHVFHKGYGSFCVHPVDKYFFCCQRLRNEPELTTQANGIFYGSTGRGHGPIGTHILSVRGFPVVSGLKPIGRSLMEDSIWLCQPRWA